MKIIIILLFLNLSLFASGSTENSTNGSEVAQSTQNIQKKPIFVDVSDVT